MSKKYFVLMAVSFALMAAGSLFLYARDLERSIGLGGQEMTLLVAARPLLDGSEITEKSLITKQFPATYAPPRAVPADKRHLALGRTLTVSLKKGEPLLWSDLTSTDSARQELADVIPDGARALALPISGLSGALLRASDHVDIIGTFNGLADRKSTTITLLQNVSVLAVGDQVGVETMAQHRSGRGARNVTLSVTPEEAELLIHAMDRGKLSLTLRNPDDVISVNTLDEIRFASLLQPEVRKKTQERRDKMIEIISPRRR